MSLTAGDAQLSPPGPGSALPPADQAPNLAPPPGNPRFPLFDSLRAVAALSVFLGHTVTGTTTFAAHPTLYLYAVELADEGVAIFFLISGFLLYRPFLVARRGGPALSLTGYARRRLLRIVPAYWAALTVFLLAGLVDGVTAGNWWVFYGFGQIYSASTIGHGIGAAWTLCIEVTFYAALPLFSGLAGLLAVRRTGRRGAVRADVVLLVLLAAGSLAFRAHFSRFADFATVSTLPGTFTWFALGMGLAVASVSYDERALPALVRAAAARPLACWAAAVLVLVGLHELAVHPGSMARALTEHVLYAVAALLVLLPGVFDLTTASPVRRLLASRWLTWIGLVSYAFYLYHTIVIQELDRALRGTALGLRYAVVLVGAFAITCVCSALSYYGLERPAMRWRRRPGARARQAG